MLDILGYLPAKRKATPSGWVSFNAVCCAHNGSTADKRSRGGLKPTEQGWSYHCFNCNYTASFILGRTLSYKARRLLGWMGVPDAEIDALKAGDLSPLLSFRKVVQETIRSIGTIRASGDEVVVLGLLCAASTEVSRLEDSLGDISKKLSRI